MLFNFNFLFEKFYFTNIIFYPHISVIKCWNKFHYMYYYLIFHKKNYIIKTYY